MPRIIFVTGTDTGVGKTLLTGLLLYHLRQEGCHALAMKPFCSGSRADSQFLNAIQDGELSPKEITPFFFSEPLAPLVAARKHRQSIRLADALQRIRRLARRCECLLVEGIGGVMVPLGEGFAVVDLIARLGCPAILVSGNCLGTINHTLLSTRALQHAGIKELRLVLSALPKGDASSGSNSSVLTELVAPAPVFSIPFLGRKPERLAGLDVAEKKVKKILARILS